MCLFFRPFREGALTPHTRKHRPARVTPCSTMARTATLLALLAAGASAQQDSGQFPQGSDRWSLMFRHFSSVNGDAVYCECMRARVCG